MPLSTIETFRALAAVIRGADAAIKHARKNRDPRDADLRFRRPKGSEDKLRGERKGDLMADMADRIRKLREKQRGGTDI